MGSKSREKTIYGLSAKVGLLALGFTILLLGVVGTCVWVLEKATEDALIINVAGRQRMLSQKLGVHAQTLNLDLSTGNANAAAERNALAETVALFSSTQESLTHGGEVTVSNGESVVLAAPTDVVLQALLTRVNKIWGPTEALLSQPSDALASPAAQLTLLSSLTQLLDTTNAVTERIQLASKRRIAIFEGIQLGAALVGLAALLMTWKFWSRRGITDPLAEICNALDQASLSTVEVSAQIDFSSKRVLAASTIQAEAIQETVAAMNQITAMVAQTTSRAGTSANEARVALDKTRAGKGVIVEMNGAMHSLGQANEKLEQISKIFKQIAHKTTVINDIAFKTKMLSINAAVEAARAGQHGRGFAVVASEVGNLSKLSSDAATEVRALLVNSQQEVSEIIDATSNQVKAGSRVTAAVEGAFSDIAIAVQEVAEQALAISQAANEQELGVKQTAAGIEQIHSKMLETRTTAEASQEQLSSLTLHSEVLVQLGVQLRTLVYGDTDSGAPQHPARQTKPQEFTAAPSIVHSGEDSDAAAMVKRLGTLARGTRQNAIGPVANDNTHSRKAAS